MIRPKFAVESTETYWHQLNGVKGTIQIVDHLVLFVSERGKAYVIAESPRLENAPVYY